MNNFSQFLFVLCVEEVFGKMSKRKAENTLQKCKQPKLTAFFQKQSSETSLGMIDNKNFVKYSEKIYVLANVYLKFDIEKRDVTIYFVLIFVGAFSLVNRTNIMITSWFCLGARFYTCN